MHRAPCLSDRVSVYVGAPESPRGIHSHLEASLFATWPTRLHPRVLASTLVPGPPTESPPALEELCV
jgi:hypothetical protein